MHMFYGDDTASTDSDSSYCCSCSSDSEDEADQITELRWATLEKYIEQRSGLRVQHAVETVCSYSRS